MAEQERYRPVRLHRVGGMAALWVAHDTNLDREVCLKVIRDDADGDAHGQFEREAKIGGWLRHPNIVPVHEFGRIQWPGVKDKKPTNRLHPHLFISQTFIEGTDLKQPIDRLRVNRAATLEWPRRTLLNLFMRVLDGMAYAHDRGIVHRDLKPGNILFDPKLHFVYIVDWGLAKRIDEKDVSTDSKVRDRAKPYESMPGFIKGTPHYISPEQARGEVNRIDQRSDIYSLGVMLYQLLTYTVPIHDDDVYALIERIETEPIIPPKKYIEDQPDKERMADPIPAELDEISVRCLAKNPAERYQSAVELKKDLEAHLTHDVPSGTLTTFEPGTYLIKEGEFDSDLFYLISGEVVIEKDGREIGRSTEGWLGTVGALSGRRTASVRAARQCRTYAFTNMTHPKFVDALRKDPAMAMGLLEDLARNLVDTDRRFLKDSSRS